MSFIWIILIGLAAGAIAKLLIHQDGAGGLFILGIAGAGIAGVMQYSLNQPVGFAAPSVGAVTLLAIFAATSRPEIEQRSDHEADDEDFRRAA